MYHKRELLIEEFEYKLRKLMLSPNKKKMKPYSYRLLPYKIGKKLSKSLLKFIETAIENKIDVEKKLKRELEIMEDSKQDIVEFLKNKGVGEVIDLENTQILTNFYFSPFNFKNHVKIFFHFPLKDYKIKNFGRPLFLQYWYQFEAKIYRNNEDAHEKNKVISSSLYFKFGFLLNGNRINEDTYEKTLNYLDKLLEDKKIKIDIFEEYSKLVVNDTLKMLNKHIKDLVKRVALEI